MKLMFVFHENAIHHLNETIKKEKYVIKVVIRGILP